MNHQQSPSQHLEIDPIPQTEKSQACSVNCTIKPFQRSLTCSHPIKIQLKSTPHSVNV